jgi:hypothetical protein
VQGGSTRIDRKRAVVVEVDVDVVPNVDLNGDVDVDPIVDLARRPLRRLSKHPRR